ncbi:MAG: hypothetical protein RSB52_02855 [Acidaminococcaceae bacterium]
MKFYKQKQFLPEQRRELFFTFSEEAVEHAPAVKLSLSDVV